MNYLFLIYVQNYLFTIYIYILTIRLLFYKVLFKQKIFQNDFNILVLTMQRNLQQMD